MPKLTVSGELFTRVSAFKPVVDSLVDEAIPFDEYVALVLGQGIDSMLTDILASVDDATLLRSFQQLGAQHPENVYSFVAETLRRGSAAPSREEARRRLGFHPGEHSAS